MEFLPSIQAPYMLASGNSSGQLEPVCFALFHAGLMRIVLDDPMEAIKIVKGIDGWDVNLTTRYCLAEAYEALGLWKQADNEYHITCELCQQAAECADFATRSFLGMSRVTYKLKDYEHAVHLMDHLIQQNCRVLGAHKLLALPLLAMAKSSTTTELVHGYSSTLAGAIEIMYKGVMFEEQWDEIKMQANRATAFVPLAWLNKPWGESRSIP
jgi:hypothetical protein